MTPLERSRFAAGVAQSAGEEREFADDVPEQTGLVGSARRWIDSTRKSVITGHGWTTGLCDCFLDVKSCFASFCLGPIVLAQLIGRIWRSRTICLFIAVVLSIGGLANFFVGSWDSGCTLEYCDEDAAKGDQCRDIQMETGEFTLKYSENGAMSLVPVLGNYSVAIKTLDKCGRKADYADGPFYLLLSLMSTLFFFAMCFLTALVRRRIRMRDNIPVTLVACLDDYICATCCLPCVTAQIMRHEGMAKERYQVISTDGTRDGALMV